MFITELKSLYKLPYQLEMNGKSYLSNQVK